MDAYKKKIFTGAVLFVAFGMYALYAGSVLRTPVSAAGASLLFSPAGGSFSASTPFSIKVVLNSGGGVGVNAADGLISFDPDALSVQSVSKEGSIFNLWTSDPAFSNKDGTVTFSGGGTTAYTGSAGTVMTVVFKALKSGSTTIKFSSGSALAADGQGTNVLSGLSASDIAIKEGGASPSPAPPPTGGAASKPSPAPAPAAPPQPPFEVVIDITSGSHPDQNKWYAHSAPQFNWKLTPDVGGVSTLFNQTSDSVPKRKSEGLLDTRQYNDVKEGIWYFHIRFMDSLGNWSETMHRKAQVDRTAPEQFSINTQNGAGPQWRTVLLFSATDTLSGIDRYDVSFDGKMPIMVALTDIQNNTYNAPALLPGRHTVTVRAFDRADNSTEEHTDFDIPGIPIPKITNFPGTIFEFSPIILEGVADNGASVMISIDDKDEEEIISGKLIADQTGHWLYVVEPGLPTGKYKIDVSMITVQGAEASSTEIVTTQVIARPFIERFGFALIILLFACIGGLIGYGVHRKKLLDITFAMADAEINDTRGTTKAVFEALREEVDEKINCMEGGASHAAGEMRLEPEHVLDALKNALAVSEETIGKGVDDIEKALKPPKKNTKRES